MQKPAATIDPSENGPDESREAAQNQSQAPQGRVMKFTYASGTRPLDGYTIKRGIGIGGFGEVYFATSDAGKEVALKRILRNLDVELRGVRQCLNLKHQNLIALWDIKYDKDGEAWVVMEYVAGESLKDVIDRNPNGLPIEEVNSWFSTIAAGVCYLHDHGIVHRDLKPGNVFLDDDIVKIGDYGLSKFISCSRRSGQTESVGTFHYMAPEIGKGVYGKEIDVYALGIILFEMLTGQVPFDGESSQEIIMKHLTADPELDHLSDPYRRVIRSALSKDPDQRYESVSEMLADLAGERPIKQSTLEENSNASGTSSSSSPMFIGPNASADTLFISDDDKSDIVMGDVQEVVTAQPVPEPRSQSQHRVAPLTSSQHYPVRQQNSYSTSGQQPARHQRRRRNSKEELREYLQNRPQTDRLAELTGSLLLSAVVCAVMCLLGVAVSASSASSVQWWQLYTWLTLTSTGGAWAILSIGKLWEGKKGEAIQRRFIMLVAGLVLGAFSYFAGESLLMVQWPDRRVEHLHEMYQGGAPLLSAYLVFLSSLFVILRWWKQADPIRTFRYNFWDTLVCGLTAWVLFLIWQFPAWGIVVAVAISIAVQLAAPWMNPNQRNKIRQQAQEA